MKLRLRKASQITDEELVVKARKGDRNAFEMVYDRYASPLSGYFRRMLAGDSAQAEDFTQELFVKVIDYWQSFDSSKSFKTWIYSIASNMCKNQYRHDSVREKARLELTYINTDSYEIKEWSMDRQQFQKELGQALDALNTDKRETFLLRFKHELTIKEIAEITGASEGTVKSRLFYALRELAEELKEFKPEQRQNGSQ